MDQDLSAKLPPPHDEEPAQLRSDILDELRDHLNCATERERRRLKMNGQSADAVTVWQSVIERFGDPSALARQLWFDAMKGRLMTQRVMLGAVAVGLIALVGWMTLLSRSLTAVIDENQRATQQILERMGKESPAQIVQRPSELAPVKFTLVQKTAEGIPVIGQVVHFDQHRGTEDLRIGDLSELTDLHGVADFGILPYGIYDLTIESIGGTLEEEITLRPGRPIDLTIVVPGVPPVGQVKFDVPAPDWETWDWLSEDHKPPTGEPVLLVRYSSHSEVKLDQRVWKGPEETVSVVVRKDGIYAGLIEIQESGQSLVQFGQGTPASRDLDIQDVDRLINLNSRMDTLTLPVGSLRLTAEWFYVVEKAPEASEEQILIRPAARSLNPDWVNSLKAAQKLDRHKFPLVIDIDPTAPQPQVIPILSNDPSTIDGEDRPLLLPSGGGQGFF